MLTVAAILITGGSGQLSAEVFLPSSNTSCELPGLQVERYIHSQDGLLLCGGTFSSPAATCEEFSPATGTWARTSHTLQDGRNQHVSWKVEEGTILMGGYFSGTENTSEIVKHDSTTESSFDMNYYTV